MTSSAQYRSRRSALLVAALIGLGLAATPGTALAAAPAAPALVAPTADATGVSSPVELRVRADDPDGGPLQVRFFGRPATAAPPPTPGPDFTFAVIPDTQGYWSAERQPMARAQVEWLRDNRTPLNLAFASHLGDLVNTPTSTAEWAAASQTMSILDTGGVPNSVIPGNHDYSDITTGAATQYRQYFPVSRYAQASWNSPTARYGGYFGQNQFGPDAADRQNMNSWATFTAGGLDFLVLNIEFDAPDDVLDWARRVLAANPARRAILVTHSFLNYDGQRPTERQRPGGNSPQEIWSELVAPSCGIFLVASGHFSEPDIGEARRTDPNNCGQPVHQVLTDFQDRPNGGDGWLRYYTFSPARNEIRATTYSPFLNRTETDADSSFTLPYAMTSGGFVELGAAGVGSGQNATVSWPDRQPNTAYEWYATVSDGTTTTTGPTWRFTTGAGGPTPAVLAADGFGRTVAGGWGSADTGGAWAVAGTASRYAVNGGAGVHTVPPAVTTSSALTGVSSTGTDTTVALSLGTIPNGPVYLTVAGRRVGSGQYGARIKTAASGALELAVTRDDTVLAGGSLPGVTLAAGQQLNVRVQVEGTAPTTLRAKAWKAGTTEPAVWQVTRTDSTAALQAAGGIGLSTYLSSSATTGSVTVRWDNLSVTGPGGGPPPANTPPTAAFTSTTNGLSVGVSGSGSADPDGTITAYAWTFGDGGTATGASAAHTYAAAGSYPVTLTVTDDDGAIDTETTQVTVIAPTATVLAADAFGRTVSGGWGSAETGGAWAVTGTASRYAVTGGAGTHTVPSAVETTSTLAGVSATSTDTTVKLALSTIPNGAAYLTVAGRRLAVGEYGARIKTAASGALELALTRDGTVLAGGALPGVTLAAGQQLIVRLQVEGTAPTTLRARAWKAGTTEPAAWQVTRSDSTPALQAPGGIRLTTYLSSSATNGPLTVRYDDLRATSLPATA